MFCSVALSSELALLHAMVRRERRLGNSDLYGRWNGSAAPSQDEEAFGIRERAVLAGRIKRWEPPQWRQEGVQWPAGWRGDVPRGPLLAETKKGHVLKAFTDQSVSGPKRRERAQPPSPQGPEELSKCRGCGWDDTSLRQKHLPLSPPSHRKAGSLSVELRWGREF